MCGLVALASSTPTEVARVEAALASMRSRGPDGRGVYRSEDGRVALGHVRLAVVGGASGAQPVSSDDGRVVAVVNGEVYRAEALGRELAALGLPRRTACDSELLVSAYLAWGDDAFDRLRGELAFVLYDLRRERVVAGRDRFGVKPLVYAERGGELAIASKPSALFAMGVPARWSPDALAQVSRTHYARADETLFDGVSVLPPGRRLVRERGETRLVRAWDWDPVEPVDERDEDAVERVRVALTRAVTDRLVADRPPVFQLSAGLDSAGVLGLAIQSGARAVAYTVGFDDPAYDESTEARALGEALGAEVRVVGRSDVELARAFADAVAAGEGVVINAHASAKLALSAAIRADGGVSVLSGEGADELFAGYAHLRVDAGEPLRGSNAASRGLMLPRRDVEGLAAAEARMGFTPTWLAAKVELGRRVAPLVPGLACGFDPVDRLLSALPDDRLGAGDRLDRAAYTWSRLALEGYILRTLGDPLELASSVEGRTPFLDPEVFDAAAKLGPARKIRGGVEKWALREALVGVVPERWRSREKHPFLAPPLTRSRAAVDVLAELVPDRHPFVDTAALRAALFAQPDAAVADATARDPALLLVLSLLVLEARLGVS